MQNLSSSGNITQIFTAFEKKDFSSASTLILANINDLSGENANGQTVLHLLVSESKNIPNYDELLNKVLLSPSISKIINKQDANGNSPLHIAVMNNDYGTCDRLIMAGADMKLKNKAGLHIEVEKNKEAGLTDTAASLTSATMKNYDANSTATDTLAMRTSNSSYTVGSRGMPDAMTQTQQHSENNNVSSVSHASSVFIKKGGVTSVSSSSKTESATSSNKDEPGILGNLINFLTRPFRNTTEASTSTAVSISNVTTTQKGGSETESASMVENNLVNTSEFIDELVSSFKNNQNITLSQQTGGKKKSKSKQKRMTRSSESEEMSEMSELSRMIQNQATEIHTRTITKIAELLGISEEEARVYKAYIYGQVKNEHPELNNYDRAVEMEKRITKDYLESISKKDIKDLTKTIEKNRSERESKSASPKSEKAEKSEKKSVKATEVSEKPKKERKTKKDTEVLSETSYSLTSLSMTSSSF